MTDLTKSRIISLMKAVEAHELVVYETPQGVILGVAIEDGFAPLAAVWPERKPRDIGFKPESVN